MRQGFTLLEISIVLIIVGLIIGGITVGQDMIRSAELNSVVSDVSKYKTAVNSFKLQYDALPGDMDNATAYWGAAHATPATCLTTVGSGTETCNGDDDEKIESPAAASQYGELFTFWQHLANAELIPGSYTGISGSSANNHALLDINVPKTAISGTLFTIRNHASDWWSNGTVPGNSLIFGQEDTTNVDGDQASLTAREMASIDEKIDDGEPETGTVFSNNNTTRPNCVTTDVASTTEYQLTLDTIGCTPYFHLRLQ